MESNLKTGGIGEMIVNTQPLLLAELKRRIAEGVYTGKLPTASALAVEFGVNVKTVNKVLNQLAAAGMVERRRHTGTQVRQSGVEGGNRVVEVVFSGFTAPFLHPFWSEVLEGVHETLSASDYKMMLNHIVSDRTTHQFDLSQIRLSDAAGRVVIGPGELRLLSWIAATRRPMICAGDEVGSPDFPEVFFDFRQGIADAVQFLLKRRKCRNIGFIGHISSMANIGMLQKFHAYLNSLQRFQQVDPALIERAWPTPGEARAAMERMLERKCPDALLLSFEVHLPEILELFRERGISIPIVGCDGLPLMRKPDDYHTIRAPRRRCGQLAAELLLGSIRNCGSGKIGRHPLPAVFE